MTHLKSALSLVLAFSVSASAAVSPTGSILTEVTATVPVPEENETIEQMMAESDLVAANGSRVKRAAQAASKSITQKTRPLLEKATRLAGSGQYQEASKMLFQMSRDPQFASDSTQIKYILGLMLFEMKLNQSAAFVFYDVVRQETKDNPKSKYMRQSLEKLTMAADALGSDVLLRYALKQIDEEEFPAASRDMLYYRVGEVKMQEKEYLEAAREYSKIRPASLFFSRARYQMALALAEAGQLEKAQSAFEDLIRFSSNNVTDRNRVNAQLGRARILYQKQDFSAAMDAYQDIPRDTEQWHDALFESSWAMLRDGRFRSALSNFHSLHSPYYEDVYQPESLFLRAVVYLYICRYDEMQKVINLFEREYKPILRDVRNMLTTVNDPSTYYRELAKYNENRSKRRGLQIPYTVVRNIAREADVRRTFTYLRNLEMEKRRLDSMPGPWRSAGIGQYARKILEKRIEASQVLAGRQIRRHLGFVQDELKDLMEQTGFLRFEMLSSKKEVLRKEIAGKGLLRDRVDENNARQFYIQNGFEYWPFAGEYWLDEIGNYHYVGVKACE